MKTFTCLLLLLGLSTPLSLSANERPNILLVKSMTRLFGSWATRIGVVPREEIVKLMQTK